jgi:hypothetical protein
VLQIVVNPSRNFSKKIRDLLMSPKTYVLNELIKETPASSTNPMVHVNMCGREIYLLLLCTSSDKLFCKNLLICVIKILWHTEVFTFKELKPYCSMCNMLYLVRCFKIPVYINLSNIFENDVKSDIGL